MESKFVEIDLGKPLPDTVEAADGESVEAVVWLHGRPLGRVAVPRHGTRVYRRGLARSIVRLFADPMLRELVRNGMATPGLETFAVADLLTLPAAEPTLEPGRLTVVICTAGSRPESLDRCLAAVVANSLPPAEVIVVWRGPADGFPPRRGKVPASPHGGQLSRQELEDRWSTAAVPVRWIEEPASDLARARRLAVEATQTPLVAFVDESVRVDVHWVASVCRTFQDHPNAMVVTGVMLPDASENEARRHATAALDRMAWRDPFAFRCGCLRPDERFPREWFNAHQLGTAAATAYRTDVFKAVGSFAAIAAGAAEETCQHLDLWLRVLDARLCLVREPAASCRRSGAPTLAEAAAEVRGVAAGISASLVAAAARRPGRLPGILLTIQWFLRTAVGDLFRSSRGPARSLAWARLQGHVGGMVCGAIGLFRRRSSRPAIEQAAAVPPSLSETPFNTGRVVPIDLAVPAVAVPVAEIRAGDVPAALQLARFVPVAEVLTVWRGSVLGLAGVVTGSRPITLEQVRRACIDRHWDTILVRLLGLGPELPHDVDGSTRAARAESVREAAARIIGDHLATPQSAVASPQAPFDHNISIVIPSRDRPAELRECLQAILRQRTERRIEIIVVDNHPESGITPPVVAEFPGVRLLAEARQGSAYARNRGLLATRGSIIVCVDDDVVVPDGWLESLLAPFADPAVAVVTGNIVPFQLDTSAERLAEACSSLSAGSEPFSVDGEWYRSSPQAIQAWDFGTSANVAVRARVFADPAVGLFAESLGPGTPVGAGEDPYFMYRVVKGGYGIRYSPDAWVWHRHRRSKRELGRQVYSYAKSAVGYYLLTGLRHGDSRSRRSLFGGLQRHYVRRLAAAVGGRIDVPVWLVLVEIAGHVAGGLSFAVSEIRRRALARDPAHIPTPAALPARPAGGARWSREPWAIQRGTLAGRRARLPHFLVIGAQKSGTTALNNNLRKHPSIEVVPNFSSHWPGKNLVNRKETWFFNGWGANFDVNTLDDYAMLFNDNGRLQGEVCPTYAAPGAIERIAETIPDAKLIYICREPVSRIESAINHMMQWQSEYADLTDFCSWKPALAFEENLQQEIADPSRHGLLRMGLYADTVERVLRRFPPERLLLLIAEEYRENPQQTYDTIAAYLGVEPFEIDHEDDHARKYATRLTPEQWNWLEDFYRPHNERFFAILGREVPVWSASVQARVTAGAGS